MSESVVESLKEGLRLALFAGISYLVTYLLQQLNVMDQNETYVVLGTFALRMADKWLAINNKSIIPMDKARGISGF